MATFSLPAQASQVRNSSWCGSLMALSDVLSLVVSMIAAVLIRDAFSGAIDPWTYWRLVPLLVFFTGVYAAFGLYPGVATGPVRELRQLTLATTLVFILLATALFLVKEGTAYSRIVFLIAWALALFLAPLGRAAMRAIYGKEPWWGYPVAVFGSAEGAQRIVDALRAKPQWGLHPVAVFADDDPSRHESKELRARFREAAFYSREMGLKRAVIAMPDLPEGEMLELLETHARGFSKVYVVPGLAGLSSLGIEPRDLCDSLALEVRRSLLLPSRQFAKRLLDQVSSALMLLMLAPLMALIAILIRLESPGAPVYSHRRIGHRGRLFPMYKFRSMYRNSDEILTRLLREHPEIRLEWEANRKLRNDPRVTRLGRFLRKTSLDELPQLWNVLRGDMSLVGPRPIVRAEITKFGNGFGLYCRVVPGLTGLWQVSGRSNTDYDRRVALDTYYIRNWSPWFDIYLLARTIRIVLRGEGAY